MENKFSYWKQKHDEGEFEVFSSDISAQLWLKIKSITRKEYLDEFINIHKYKIKNKKILDKFKELFLILSEDILNSHEKLDEYIKSKKSFSKVNESEIICELNKLQSFVWGGDYKNSLDKYLVSEYVKQYRSFEELSSVKDKINLSAQNYVFNSWYNHWSSIIIENIFKSHSKILPAIGEIKNVDFFIENIPFDLKVTHFPVEYLKQERKKENLDSEINYLKIHAKKFGISFNKKSNPNDIYHEIIQELQNCQNEQGKNVLKELTNQNLSIINKAKEDPKNLIRWLYENQGEMRFGSENRIFLILIDSGELKNSWKLKCDINILKPMINIFIDNFSRENLDSMKIDFTYKSKKFTTFATLLFVIK